MKKVLFVLSFVVIAMVSCKKEESVQPVKVEKAQMGPGTERNLLGMD
jgi:hypothetical protein